MIPVVWDMSHTTKWSVVLGYKYWESSEEWMDLASKLYGNRNKYYKLLKKRIPVFCYAVSPRHLA